MEKFTIFNCMGGYKFMRNDHQNISEIIQIGGHLGLLGNRFYNGSNT